MDNYKKGYHITKKSNLYNIQKNGLQPRIGRRSNTVREHEEILCFSPRLESMPIWKGRLYKNQSFDELAILILDLDGIQYLKNILQDISSNGNNSHYEISEKPITELFLEKPILDNERK